MSTVKHPLPWRRDEKDYIVDANGVSIVDVVAAVNSLQPWLVVPKLCKDHPQAPRDGLQYLVWYDNGLVGTLFTLHQSWPKNAVAWWGPIPPLPQPDALDVAWHEWLHDEKGFGVSKDCFKAGWDAAQKEMKK